LCPCRGDDVFAVSAHGDAGDSNGVLLEGLEFLAAGRLPEDRRPVPRPGDDVLAVVAHGHARDSRGMSLEGLEPLAAGRLPQDRRLVLRPGDDVLAVATEGHAPDGGGVPRRLESQLEPRRFLREGEGLPADEDQDGQKVRGNRFHHTPPLPNGRNRQKALAVYGDVTSAYYGRNCLAGQSVCTGIADNLRLSNSQRFRQR